MVMVGLTVTVMEGEEKDFSCFWVSVLDFSGCCNFCSFPFSDMGCAKDRHDTERTRSVDTQGPYDD